MATILVFIYVFFGRRRNFRSQKTWEIEILGGEFFLIGNYNVQVKDSNYTGCIIGDPLEYICQCQNPKEKAETPFPSIF